MAKLGSFSVVQKTAAASDGKPREPDTFEFEGEDFRVVDTVPSLLPLMQFAAAMAATDDGSIDMNGLAAMYNMLRYCIEPADWARFERLAMKAKAGAEDLLPITETVWEAVTSRPTNGPSGSPDGPSNTSTSSRAGSHSPTDPRSGTDRSTGRPSVIEGVATENPDAWAPPPGRPDLSAQLTPVGNLAA